jgi:hypothetical protein
MENFRKPITTTLTLDDFEYCKSNKLMFSVLIHDRIEQLKGGNIDLERSKEVKDLSEELVYFKKRFEEAMMVLSRHDLKKEFYKDIKAT